MNLKLLTGRAGGGSAAKPARLGGGARKEESSAARSGPLLEYHDPECRAGRTSSGEGGGEAMAGPDFAVLAGLGS